jgi:hypothetical protein
MSLFDLAGHRLILGHAVRAIPYASVGRNKKKGKTKRQSIEQQATAVG